MRAYRETMDALVAAKSESRDEDGRWLEAVGALTMAAHEGAPDITSALRSARALAYGADVACLVASAKVYGDDHIDEDGQPCDTRRLVCAACVLTPAIVLVATLAAVAMECEVVVRLDDDTALVVYPWSDTRWCLGERSVPASCMPQDWTLDAAAAILARLAD